MNSSNYTVCTSSFSKGHMNDDNDGLFQTGSLAPQSWKASAPMEQRSKPENQNSVFMPIFT